MSGILVNCEHCNGVGKVRCHCQRHTIRVLRPDRDEHGFVCAEAYIGRCRVCSQLWKVYRSDDGEASDYVWLKPGHEHAGYAFSFEEAAPFLAPVDLLHLPYVELLKHVPFDKLVEYRKQLEATHPGVADLAAAG